MRPVILAVKVKSWLLNGSWREELIGRAGLASGQVVMYADASTEKKEGADVGVGPVIFDRTRQVVKEALGELTENDLTLCWHELCQCNGASDRWHGDSGACAT